MHFTQVAKEMQAKALSCFSLFFFACIPLRSLREPTSSGDVPAALSPQ